VHFWSPTPSYVCKHSTIGEKTVQQRP